MLTHEGFDVIGDAGDGESALTAVEQLHPDNVLVDVHLGDGIDGFELARRLADLPQPPKVVLTSSRDQSTYLTRIERAPIEGFVSKDELTGEQLALLFGCLPTS